ncbi:MAG TPA: sulfotransferase [Candidatus Acidoferrales bacterium]|nr:sulfotransferase [Candidatus Acidoferrales bacterium]
MLLKAYDEEARLSAFGRVAVRWDMIRFLSNLLRLRDEEKRAPGILDERIERPVFILGLPRSGTTFLHNLLAQDPGNRVPLAWQTIYPYPMRAGVAGRGDRRQKIVARQFASFVRLAPELPSLHPLDANAAQECIEITGQVMRSLRFDTTHYVPSYQRWLEDAGHSEAYRFHKRFIQHLQHQSGDGGGWILKSPDHIYALDALLETYSDARFVFVHRDPLKVLASVARLTEVLREPFTREIDRLQIGRQVTDRWAEGSQRLIEASERLRSAPERIFHVRYKELVGDPLGTVNALYRHFGRTPDERAELLFKRAIAARPNGGYGKNHYRFEDYGIDPAAERRRHSAYIAHFRIEPERDAATTESQSKLRMAG